MVIPVPIRHGSVAQWWRIPMEFTPGCIAARIANGYPSSSPTAFFSTFRMSSPSADASPSMVP